MKNDLKINWKGDISIKPNDIGSFFAKIWKKIHTLLFFIFLIGSCAIGMKIWQQSLYGAGWSDQKKQAYLDAQNKGVTFKEDDFNKTIAEAQDRKDASNAPYQSVKDIFAPYK